MHCNIVLLIYLFLSGLKMSNNKSLNLFEDSTQLLDSEQTLIQSQCLEKNIQWLCHFTPRSNLELIKQHGLLPRNKIQGSFIVTDKYRYDGNSNTTCLSISKPNKWMFDKKQQEGFDLCLLLISPEILYLKRCAFYPYNAATASYRGIPIENLMGIDALEATFSDPITFQKSGHAFQSHRRNSNLNIAEPTSDQAEVQCYESIEPEYIQYIIEEDIPLTYQEICRFIESHENSLEESILIKHRLLENEKQENETLIAINDDIRSPLAVDIIEEEGLKQDKYIPLISASETTPTETIDKNSDINEKSKIIKEMIKSNSHFDTSEDIIFDNSQSKQQKPQENTSSGSKSTTNYSSSADGCGVIFIIVVLIIMFIF